MSVSHACAVAAVAAPSSLLLLAPPDADGLCEQFAQEGYHVLHVHYPAPDAAEALVRTVATCEGAASPWALVSYGFQASDAGLLAPLADAVALKALVHYSPLVDDAAPLVLTRPNGHFIPTHVHLALSQETLHASLLPFAEAQTLATLPSGSPPPIRVFAYPLVQPSPPFPLLATPMARVRPGHRETVAPHVRSAISLSYSRTLALLRQQLGPWFDLEALWEKHTLYEFAERDMPKTMATMVAEPYVNHIPTLTGGIGHALLSRFYKYHFIPKSPEDTELITMSRTVGADRVIDEMIFKCTHTTEIDWLLPDVAPTGKPLQIPMVGIVAFRGDKLTFEHIYWDQASVLVQVGLLDRASLPVAGAEVADKVLDPFGVPSNTLMRKWAESEGLPIEK